MPEPPPPRPPKKGPQPSSAYITTSTVLDALSAVAFADHIDLTLSAAVTVNFTRSLLYGEGEATRENTDRCVEAAKTALRNACTKAGIPCAYLMVLENPPTGGRGLHAHIQLHVPRDISARNHLLMELEAQLHRAFQWRWVQSASGKDDYRPMYIDALPHGPIKALETASYTLKGADPTIAERLRVRHGIWDTQITKPKESRRQDGRGIVWRRAGLQGTIHGRRLHLSRLLGKAARRNANYIDRAVIEDLSYSASPRKAQLVAAMRQRWIDAKPFGR